MIKNFYISTKKNFGPYSVDVYKTYFTLILISKGGDVQENSSPVCYSDSDEVQQTYKDWKKQG